MGAKKTFAYVGDGQGLEAVWPRSGRICARLGARPHANFGASINRG